MCDWMGDKLRNPKTLAKIRGIPFSILPSRRSSHIGGLGMLEGLAGVRKDKGKKQRQS